MWKLYRLCRMTSEAPSCRFGLTPEAGYSAWDALDFDLAVLEFGEAFERELNATELRPVEKSASKTPKAPFPKWTPKQLSVRFLSIPEEALDAAARSRNVEAEALAEEILAGRADWLLGG